jgi:DNA-binding CsgD family transcriptional regulator
VTLLTRLSSRSISAIPRWRIGWPTCSPACRACAWRPRARPAAEPDGGLTPREREVLALLAEGASNKAIARRLGISVHTAKFHVGSLIDKLDATGRTDAVAHAARTGVIHL